MTIGMIRNLAITIAAAWVLSACASTPSSPPSYEASMEAVREIEREIIEADAELKRDAESVQTSLPEKIPLEINERVQKWIHYFSVTDRERFQRFLQRGNMYKETVHEILKEHGVPRELYYLAMIESGYVTHAKSRARAVGPWQFIRGTGIRYGLKQDHYLDERRDIIRSTEAAARYLKALYTAFQSWYLAMASYNAGEGRILGAILRGSSRDFWALVEKKALPPETRDYVPKFLAAAIIGRHPEKYGFHNLDSTPFPRVEQASVGGGLRLDIIATKLDVPVKTLKTLNPHLVRSMTPPSLKTYPIWVPKGMAHEVAKLQPVLAKHQKKSRPSAGRAIAGNTRSGKKHGVSHRVRPGEALSMISHRYKIPVSKIKRVNRLRNNRIYAGQKLFIPVEI